MIAGDELEKKAFLLRKELKENPKSKEKWSEMGMIFLQKGDYSAALGCFDKALALDPKNSDSWNNKGDTLFRLDRIDEAEGCFQESIRLNHENHTALYNMGIVHAKRDEYDDALEFFDRALEINPNNDFAAMWRIKIVKSIRKGERKVWLFVGSSDTWKAKKGITTTWGMHDNSQELPMFRQIAKGDIVLAYRRPPENDISFIHMVDSWPYLDKSTAWTHRIELREYVTFKKPISLSPRDEAGEEGKKKRKRIGEILKKYLEGKGDKTIYEIDHRIWATLKEVLVHDYPEYADPLVALTELSQDASLMHHIDVDAVKNQVMVKEETLLHILTAIRSGRNVLLYGPARSGKRELLKAIVDQLCGKYFDKNGAKRDNYTTELANPSWTFEDVFGRWQGRSEAREWRNGFFTYSVDMCSKSLKTTGKPHYLILQNIDSVVENRYLFQSLGMTVQRGEHPFLSWDIPVKISPPSEFRILATIDVDAVGLPPDFGKMRKYFSPVEMEIPKIEEEYESIPRLVRRRLTSMGVMAEDEIEAKTMSMRPEQASASPFDGDIDGSLLNAYRKLMAFVEENPVPPEDVKKACGIRTYRGAGNQTLVDIMLVVVNAVEGYPRDKALEDAIAAELLPGLQDLTTFSLGNIMLKAIEVFGLESKVANTLDRMIWEKGPNPTMKIEMGKNAKFPGGGGKAADDMESRMAREREMLALEKKKQEMLAREKLEQEKRDKERREKERLEKQHIDAERQEKEKQTMAQANEIPVDYHVDMKAIFSELSIHENVVNQVIANLESGRNVILFGPPGCGKTKLATLLGEQLCGTIKEEDTVRPNYTILTANAEWDNYEMVGGIAPVVDDETGQVAYRFKDGFVTGTVRKCISSLVDLQKPHYLVIDEFNRANIDEAFGKLFTIFEYREEQPLLSDQENSGVELRVPKQYRIIGTMNAQDKNTLFDLGYALMRRFAFIEVSLPDKEDEYKRMGQFVELRMRTNVSSAAASLIFSEKLRGTMFPNDPEDVVYKEYNKLMKFLDEEPLPDEGEEVARGVRTYRRIGTSQIIDCVVTVLNAPKGYSMQEAMEDAVVANILPQLENLEKSQISNIHLKAAQAFGPRSRVTMALDKMVKNPMLSIFG